MIKQTTRLIRLPSLDHFRGFAILLMILANYSADILVVPPQLKHSPDIGLTVVDLIAPLFIFAVGFSYSLSFNTRNKENGTKPTYLHFIRRGLALVGIGAILSAGEFLLGFSPGNGSWGVLQAIGIAILILGFNS